jgi:hypothetical protein
LGFFVVDVQHSRHGVVEVREYRVKKARVQVLLLMRMTGPADASVVKNSRTSDLGDAGVSSIGSAGIFSIKGDGMFSVIGVGMAGS